MTYILTSKRRAAGNRAPAWPFTVNWDSPQAQGLVHWYPLSFGSPLNPVDLVARNDMAANGTVAQISRKGDAKFNSPVVDVTGATTAGWGVNTADDWNSVYGYPITMCGWFLNRESAGDQYICSISRNNTNNRYTVIIQNGGTDSIEARMFNSGELGPTKTGVWPQNEWHHAVATYTAAKYVIYMDGIERKNSTSTHGSTPTSNTRRSIGNRNTSVQGDEGRYFDIRYYNHEYKANQVWEMYAPGTRFDLWYALGRKTIFIPATVAAGIEILRRRLEAHA